MIGADGSNRRRLTPDFVDIRDPRWSPDGQWIAGAMRNDILAISADGQDVAFLVSSNNYLSSPVWAPDWSRVAYIEYVGSITQNFYIYSVDLDTQSQVLIHYDQDSIDALDWSPDGTRILFTRHTLSGSNLLVKDVVGPGLVQVNDGTYQAAFGRWSPVKLP